MANDQNQSTRIPVDVCYGVKSQCEKCNNGEPVGRLRGQIVHSLRDMAGRATKGEFLRCQNWDDECRHIGEPIGFYRFAWWPKRCRNGNVRWLVSVEDHGDGTFTLGNRAH